MHIFFPPPARSPLRFTIEIERHPTELRAFVVQQGHRGKNLLAGRQITSVASARREAERELKHALCTPRGWPDQVLIITFMGEEPD